MYQGSKCQVRRKIWEEEKNLGRKGQEKEVAAVTGRLSTQMITVNVNVKCV
ncbi:hypothetical protein SLEP1_g40237 [Rubroshorea leprosula]|uniref:Uncharacterized protein n=1 Tax=Rubroshorea leprosula TaxID=152421 RepID=A0AAV5L2T0_9ROSI|nr:hypothetical protein SLEP1_g40237 [Rubroshorea leprosula]